MTTRYPSGIGGLHHANPRQFDQYLKAYSVAMLPGNERENLSYGGKSALHSQNYSTHIQTHVISLPALSCYASVLLGTPDIVGSTIPMEV